jgi:hypothetical protein
MNQKERNMAAIINCVVSRSGANVITAPTTADLNNDMQPTMHIIVTGGVIATPLVDKATYKITGDVGGISRTFLTMKCVNTGNAARFDKA